MVILAATMALALGAPLFIKKLSFIEKPPPLAGATLLKPSKLLVPFRLDSTQGKPFTHESLQGRWTVLFFGYASCPKICPQALALMSEVWRSYPEGKPHPLAQFAFISLNPEKDSVSALQTFLPQFHPAFIGLTGNKAEVVRLSTASGVFSWTAPAEDGSDSIILDHSASILVIGPDGRLKALFSPPHDALTIAKDLKILMAA